MGAPGLTAEDVIEHLRRLLADSLEVAAEDIDPGVPLSVYGVDSRTGMELLSAAEQFAGVRLDPAILSEGLSLAQVADEVIHLRLGRPT